MSARELLALLIDARNAAATERLAPLLDERIRYWDAEHGELTGRAAVAEALAAGGRTEPETVAASGDDAVVEFQVTRAGHRYRSTEVYTFAGGRVAELKAYFDPPVG